VLLVVSLDRYRTPAACTLRISALKTTPSFIALSYVAQHPTYSNMAAVASTYIRHPTDAIIGWYGPIDVSPYCTAHSIATLRES
jgi:hypothetical protein